MYLKSAFNKYRSSPVQMKASLWYAICNILQKGISFIVIPIYVRLLTTSEYGHYSVFISWKDIVIIFATLNLYCGVFTKAIVDYKNDRDRYTSCMQGLSTVITIVVFFIYLLTDQFWETLLDVSSPVMLLLFVYFIFYPAFSFWSVRQRVENKYQKMVFVTLLTAIATPVLSIVLLYMTDLREYAVILGYLIIQCVTGLIFYIYQFYKGKVFFIKEYWLNSLKFNIPLIPHYLSLIILGQADRVMIDYLCGSDKVAIYNLAYQVSMAITIIISAINNALVPWCYEKLKQKEYDTINNITYKLCLVLFFCTIGITLIAPEVVGILGTSDYRDAVWIIPSVTISCYFTFCYNLFSVIEFYYNATRFVMVASTIGAILNVILNAVFIPIIGFIAAGYTTMICYLAFMFMHYYFMKKICQKEMDHVIPFNMKFIIFSTLLLLVIVVVCLFIYQNHIIRYLCLILIFIFMVFNRNYLKNLLKEMKGD